MINIVTVDFYLDNEKVTNTTIDGFETLLDADIVIFDPSECQNIWKDKIKHSNDGSGKIFSPISDQIRRIFDARKNEVQTLLENGKIIISMLNPIYGFYGEVENTNKYEIITNYDYLPLPQEYFLNHLKSGTSSNKNAIKHSPKEKTFFSQFYYAFKDNIEYSAYMDIDGKEHSGFFYT